ncbi:uncharacterized protein A1O9_11211 [Exophiala aquamarina CBS 119918]|uniref:NTF2-like domain-containing protein n=1 Tax=Exophiala aquamarina CBS 119918 TaxID=1182545 RepID=A0A072NY68_9EURO|nr:uncharacterized protein A1O9_11211 [Exophiala aquamarina CBS 119918]KEF52794.1 hypothetical protein A1O9_11211 [Exophiala aquamarina CBS 119918]
MKLTSFLAYLTCAATATAAGLRRRGCDSCGLSQEFAEDVVAKFISTPDHGDVATANATAQALLADGYQETSDSILSLEGQPLGGVTFEGK